MPFLEHILVIQGRLVKLGSQHPRLPSSKQCRKEVEEAMGLPARAILLWDKAKELGF